jgi:hypothetical protein
LGIQIFWNNNRLDMSNSAADLKAEISDYILGESDSFVSNFREAEDKYEDDEPEYPIENLAKAEEKFQAFLKEILKKDLASFIRSLPDNRFGDLKAKLRSRKETLEGLVVGDLLESATLNRLAGTGAFQYGRGMEGIPQFNFFESELGKPSIKIDMVIKEDVGNKVKFKVDTTTGDKDDAEITMTYPAKQSSSAIRDAKEKHLSKHGIFNPNYKEAKGEYVVEEGELVIQLPQSILDRFVQNNRLIRQSLIREVEVLEDGKSVKGKEKYRSPTNLELGFIAEKVSQLLNSSSERTTMDNIVEIDGKTYSVKLGKSKTFDISPFVKAEVNALLSENEEKFQAALKPTLDNPALIAGASVELNIVTKITEKEGGVEVTEYSESVDEKELLEEVDTLMGKLRKEILALKKYLEKDRETRKEMDEVYSSDYENYRERRAKLIEERKQLKDGEEDKEKDLTERIEFLTKELKEMIRDRKTLDSRIKDYQGRLSTRESLLEKIKTAMKKDDLAELEELVLEELEGPRVGISTSKERLSASSTAKIITSFAKDWEEGFPVLYQIKINKMGEFDLNPYARQKGSPKSFDKDIFDGLKAILNRIYRVQKVIA